MGRKLLTLCPAFALVLAAAANAGTITAPAVTRVAPDRLALSWIDKDAVDVYVADRPDATIAAAKLAAAANHDQHLDWAVGAKDRPYFLLRDHAGGAIVRIGERLVPLEHGSNFRDIGGYPAFGGKHVRWGMIFRSAGTPLLTDDDVGRVKALGLKNIVDLRSSEERVLAPTRLEGIPYSAVGYSLVQITSSGGAQDAGKVYRAFPTMLAPQLRIVFDDLLRRQEPLAYNCSAGQDRTGFATAMILSALGVTRDDIYADYHLSTTYRRPDYEMPKIDTVAQASNPVAMYFAKYQQAPGAATPRPLYDASHKTLLTYAFEEIDEKWGSVEGYLAQELGVKAADLATLRATYLE